MSHLVASTLAGVLVGFGAAAVLGLAVNPILEYVTRAIEEDSGKTYGQPFKLRRETKKAVQRIGDLERFIFYVAAWTQAWTLIAAWLGFKVASKWQSWSLYGKTGSRLGDQFRIRVGHVRFIIGTGWNLTSSILGYACGLLTAALWPI